MIEIVIEVIMMNQKAGSFYRSYVGFIKMFDLRW